MVYMRNPNRINVERKEEKKRRASSMEGKLLWKPLFIANKARIIVKYIIDIDINTKKGLEKRRGTYYWTL